MTIGAMLGLVASFLVAGVGFAMILAGGPMYGLDVRARHKRGSAGHPATTENGAPMGEAMECASCASPATALVVHPNLYRMVFPACAEHAEMLADNGADVMPVDSPEAAGYTVLRGHVVPRADR